MALLYIWHWETNVYKYTCIAVHILKQKDVKNPEKMQKRAILVIEALEKKAFSERPYSVQIIKTPEDMLTQ